MGLAAWHNFQLCFLPTTEAFLQNPFGFNICILSKTQSFESAQLININ